MHRPIIKSLADFGPLLIFFVIYFNNDNDLKLAIPPFIVATLISLIVIYFLEKKIPMVPLIGGVIITLFGGLTLYFDNPVFLYIKPTIVNIIFASILLFGRFFFQKNFLQIFFKSAFELDIIGWNKLNDRWAYFFIFLAFLNEIVWRTQPESTWVIFKVWGILPLTFIFTALQLPMINKHKI